jgi:GMP synthase (glutamine-hydrolysing)
MKKTEKKQLKVLLLQIREDIVVKEEEHRSFALHSGLELSQITVHNTFDEPLFGPEILEGHDALFVGGASEASVLRPEKYSFIQPCIDLLKFTAENSIPTFASCFGFQVAVLAFGGEIIRDEEIFEMGTCPINLTEEAKTDPIFKHISDKFYAISVHKERTSSLPENCVLLGSTELCCQTFRVKDKPFWGFQFHPELNLPCLVERLGVYQDQYTDGDNHYQKVIEGLQETPESNSLVRLFVDEILLKN